MFVDKLNSLVEATFVVTIQVCQMDFQPTETTFSQRFLFAEFQKPTTQVISNVTEMRRKRVRASTEVNIVGEVYGVTQELV